MAFSFLTRVWKHVVQKGDTVVDATCGNGYDTLAMLKMVADGSGRGCVYGMDIQKDALENTSSLLNESVNPIEVLPWAFFFYLSFHFNRTIDIVKLWFMHSHFIISFNVRVDIVGYGSCTASSLLNVDKELRCYSWDSIFVQPLFILNLNPTTLESVLVSDTS